MILASSSATYWFCRHIVNWRTKEKSPVSRALLGRLPSDENLGALVATVHRSKKRSLPLPLLPGGN